MSDDLKLVIDYFRNKAAELEMGNLELQLQVMKLQEALKLATDTADSDEGSD